MCISSYRSYIVEERSYLPCEDLVYGRMSFKGFNPEVEVGLFTWSRFSFLFVILMQFLIHCLVESFAEADGSNERYNRER